MLPVFVDRDARRRETRISGGHWEQAFSGDGGKTWETNWTAGFTKIDRKAD